MTAHHQSNDGVSRRAAIACGLAFAIGASQLAAQPLDGLAAQIASDHRTPANKARDIWRRPLETLTFFGIEPHWSVVEILPGSVGYWLEILAPYLRDKGRYIAAGRDEEATPAYQQDHARLLAKLAADPARYGKADVVKFNAGKHDIGPPGGADAVLTFRNMHNWIDRGEIDGALDCFRRALKPGGVLGVSDHRGRTDMSQEAQHRTGYIRQDYAIALIENAGFRLAGVSEAKANPKDTKDHADGVWSLPPTFRSGEADRAKYAAIGESDRFLLRFVKA